MMGFDPHKPEQRHRLRAALKAADLNAGDLWLKYFGIGGSVGEYEVEAYLQGLLSLPALQRDLLALAANELIDDVPRLHAPYSDDITPFAGQPPDRDAQDGSNDAKSQPTNDRRPSGEEPG